MRRINQKKRSKTPKKKKRENIRISTGSIKTISLARLTLASDKLHAKLNESISPLNLEKRASGATINNFISRKNISIATLGINSTREAIRKSHLKYFQKNYANLIKDGISSFSCDAYRRIYSEPFCL